MSTSGSGKPHYGPPTHQVDATLNQAAPVQNTWYPILATTSNVRLYLVVYNVQTANEDLEVRIVIDGNTLTRAQAAAVAGTNYYILMNQASTTAGTIYSGSGTTAPSTTFLLEGKSVAVAMRKTSANGAGNLQGRVMYGKW